MNDEKLDYLLIILVAQAKMLAITSPLSKDAKFYYNDVEKIKDKIIKLFKEKNQ